MLCINLCLIMDGKFKKVLKQLEKVLLLQVENQQSH